MHIVHRSCYAADALHDGHALPSYNAKAAMPTASIPATPIAIAGSMTIAPLLGFVVEPLLVADPDPVLWPAAADPVLDVPAPLRFDRPAVMTTCWNGGRPEPVSVAVVKGGIAPKLPAVPDEAAAAAAVRAEPEAVSEQTAWVVPERAQSTVKAAPLIQSQFDSWLDDLRKVEGIHTSVFHSQPNGRSKDLA